MTGNNLFAVKIPQPLVFLLTAVVAFAAGAAVISTALLCPVAVMLAARWQRARGIDGTAEETRS